MQKQGSHFLNVPGPLPEVNHEHEGHHLLGAHGLNVLTQVPHQPFKHKFNVLMKSLQTYSFYYVYFAMNWSLLSPPLLLACSK